MLWLFYLTISEPICQIRLAPLPLPLPSHLYLRALPPISKCGRMFVPITVLRMVDPVCLSVAGIKAV